MAWAVEQSAGSSSAKIVLLMLANRVNHDTGVCIPNIKTLAKECEMSVSSVKRAIQSLSKAGLIQIEPRYHEGQQISSQYHLPVRGGVSLSRGGSNDGGGVTVSYRGCHSELPGVSHRATNNQEVNQEVNHTHVDGKPSTPVCPHDQIVELYHRLCPVLPRVVVWTDARRKFLQARWRESPKHQSLEFWERYFGYVANSPFLLGSGSSRPGEAAWQADLEWLVRPSNFVKVIEGKYHREASQ